MNVKGDLSVGRAYSRPTPHYAAASAWRPLRPSSEGTGSPLTIVQRHGDQGPSFPGRPFYFGQKFRAKVLGGGPEVDGV
jgi:hypothetical protein